MDEAERCDRLGFIFAGKLAALDRPDRLKQRREAGTLVEVECDRPAAAAAALQTRAGFASARLHGAGLHVGLEEPAEAADRVRAVLEEAGFSVGRAEVVAPALEDVFFSLIREMELSSAEAAR